MVLKHTEHRVFTFFILLMVMFNIQAQSPLDKRINELVDAMTTREKIDQLINNSFGGTPTNERLNIPGFKMDDGPHGVRFAGERFDRTATAFPTGIAMAATWDEAISQQVGEAMGWEFLAFNRNQQLGPCIDICRDPRGGRSAETSGEDPYLAGHIGKAVTIGIQKTPTIATVKHFMGESKQLNRHHMNVLCSDRWLMDFGGYNFRTVVQEAGVMSLMGAYNLMNGDKCCESELMLSTILRNRWGYPFYVVSDWDAIFDSKKAIKAGTDICMGSNKYAQDLPGLVESGEVTIDELNKAVKHVLKTKILSGLTDYHPHETEKLAKTTSINAVNMSAAQKSVILLKNEKNKLGNPILPLKKTAIKVAVIGPNAMGENLNCFGSSETFPPYSISVLEGIESKIDKSNIFYAKGCDVNSNNVAGFAEAKTLAAKCDVVIFAGGLDATQEGEGFSWGTDRKGESTVLPGEQQDLINELAKVNPNLVVVIQSGGVCSLNKSISNIKGLVYSFYAGQEAGAAIADVIFGDYNPGAKMPVTMPKNDSDLPSWDEDVFRKFEENMDAGYRWFDENNIKPEFAFGYGLSYSTFEYKNLEVPLTSKAGQPLFISVDVKNTGLVKGEEVVQLYLSCPSSKELWMPKKQLRGFSRIALNPQETKTVRFTLSADDFYYWNGAQYETQTGNFTLKVGGSSDKLVLEKAINISTGELKPDLKITQIYTMPRYPIKGQEVSFYALVKNQGNAPTNASYSINFNIDNSVAVSTDNVSTVIAPGQVQLIASKGTWMGNTIEKTTLSAEITYSKEEWDTTNNSFSRSFEIFDPHLDPSLSNLAYRKSVVTQSVSGTNNGSLMLDGDYSSSWESSAIKNEIVMIDLSLIAKINNISLVCGNDFAKKYTIESSLDGLKWTLLTTKTNGSGGTETFAIPSVETRYLKISMFEGTKVSENTNKYSMYEVEVNGKILKQFPTILLEPVENQLTLPFAKTILNASRSGNPLKREVLSYRWTQLSGPAKAEINDPTSAVTLVNFKKAGKYIFKVFVGNTDGSNAKEFEINVSNFTSQTDLAFMKPTTTSGVESTFTDGGMAVDGDGKTRWSSAFKDNEWWLLDLQHRVSPDSVIIDWEGAFARKFNIQVSSDNETWQTIYNNDNFIGGKSLIPLNKKYNFRFLKINCVQRATEYGSSFYTVNVEGKLLKSSNRIPVAKATVHTEKEDEIVLDASKSTDKDKKDKLTYQWKQIAGPTSLVLKNSQTIKLSAADMKSGTYFFKLIVDDGKDVDFDLVKYTIK